MQYANFLKAMDAIACPATIMDGSHMMIKQNGVRSGGKEDFWATEMQTMGYKAKHLDKLKLDAMREISEMSEPRVYS